MASGRGLAGQGAGQLNGEVMQSARTSQLIVDAPSAAEYFSSFTTLVPGDVIEVTVEGVGTIRNRVVSEDGGPRDWRWQPDRG